MMVIFISNIFFCCNSDHKSCCNSSKKWLKKGHCYSDHNNSCCNNSKEWLTKDIVIVINYIIDPPWYIELGLVIKVVR